MPDIIARTTFPNTLKKYMDRDHLSQVDIAKRLNISKQTVSDWVHGKKFPRVDKMQELADLFGVLMSELYNPSSINYDSLNDQEKHLIELWRGADDRAREDVLSTLTLHQKKDTLSKAE